GKVKEETYKYFEQKILDIIKNESDLDGIWMFCHGAMSVENIGSGELRLMSEIRKLVGENCVIALGMDLHGNIEENFSEIVNIFRCYHTAPHTDQTDTYRRTAAALVKAIGRGEKPRTQMVKIPMIFPGEMAATTTYPFKDIIAKLEQLENEDKAVECASMFIGFAWADAARTSATVAIVPSDTKYNDYCENKAKEIADFAFSKRRDFKFEMESFDTDRSIAHAISSSVYPVCVTDMGDNPTAGTNGGSLSLLNALLRYNKSECKALVVGIYDPLAYKKCIEAVGREFELLLGIDIDEVTRPISIKVQAKRKLDIMDYDIETNPPTKKCEGVLVSCDNIDIVITSKPFAFIHKVTFDLCDLRIDDYRILVTKFGYIYPDLKKMTKRYIMANTPGESYQNVTELKYYNLTHPIYPFDDI
ncbi:MAG: M81 family metallopeptidase, partial [Oscillospiraceae bacterium]